MKLAEYMATNGLTTRQMAEKLGVTGEHIRLLRAGRRWPSRRLAETIIAETDGNVTPMDFLDLDDRARRAGAI